MIKLSLVLTSTKPAS